MLSEIKKLNILFIDIETSPNLVTAWHLGKQYISPENIVKERKIIMASWKFLNEKKVHNVHWGRDHDDKKILKTLANVISKADIVIGHNGDRFDIRWLNARNMFHKLPPIPWPKSIDTLKLVKKVAYFNSNKLAYISKYLGLQGKIKVEFSLWKDVIKGDLKALDRMIKYCNRDIIELQSVFLEILPYVDLPVHLGVLAGKPARESCPSCASTDARSLGIRLTKTRKYRRVCCNDCGASYIRDVL